MQRDREEMLAMQREMEEMDGGDTFDDGYYTGGGGYSDHDASMMFQFNGESDFIGTMSRVLLTRK